MKKYKARARELLIQIHRGFLSPQDSEALTDEEVFNNIPPSTLSSKGPNLVVSPFTWRWVMKKLKKNPNVTAYELLEAEGFKEPDAS